MTLYLSSALCASGHCGKGQEHSAKTPIEAVSGLLPIHRYKSSAPGQLSGRAAYRACSLLPNKSVSLQASYGFPGLDSRLHPTATANGINASRDFAALLGNGEAELAASVDSTHDFGLSDAAECASCDHHQ